jgi:hypothetical protein
MGAIHHDSWTAGSVALTVLEDLNYMKRLALLSALLAAMSTVSNAASISFFLDSPSQVAPPGSFLSFSGTIASTGVDEVFLNGAAAGLPYFELTVDLSPFFDRVPLSLTAGGSYSGEVFSVAVSGVAAPGDYFGSFSILGGADPSALDELAVQGFQVTVADVPEPGTIFLVFSAITAMHKVRLGSTRRRRRPRSNRAGQ